MNTPLWPAGHLPLKGGDWQRGRRHFLCNLEDVFEKLAMAATRLISPLEGEMAGRPEGGASRLTFP
ncbi:MAG: lytic murein transglycosylase [Mesorhizobium sp.]|nr:MAG: lytic murein transglycosylase [Mesorhizobium sp.]TIL51360.1 MAG: lytic murein transglycosylase [Mesorhizobium sp.]